MSTNQQNKRVENLEQAYNPEHRVYITDSEEEANRIHREHPNWIVILDNIPRSSEDLSFDVNKIKVGMN